MTPKKRYAAQAPTESSTIKIGNQETNGTPHISGSVLISALVTTDELFWKTESSENLIVTGAGQPSVVLRSAAFEYPEGALTCLAGFKPRSHFALLRTHTSIKVEAIHAKIRSDNGRGVFARVE